MTRASAPDVPGGLLSMSSPYCILQGTSLHLNEPPIACSMQPSTHQHTNRRYEHELTALRSSLLRMGELVGNQIADAIRCFLAGDEAEAEVIAARDVQVNRLDTEIDEQCVRLLALNAPAAIDLRLIMASLKITTDLERIGDQAATICKRLMRATDRVRLNVDVEIARMAEIARSMVKESLEALERNDSVLAKRVIARDDEVDGLYHQVLTQVLNSMVAEPRGIGQGTRLVFVSRSLEQIADHATNIAESVVFMVEGRDIRHRDRATR
jgi:phosphate transport system protein